MLYSQAAIVLLALRGAIGKATNSLRSDADASSYVDSILDGLEDALIGDGYDNLPLPNVSKGFSIGVGLITYNVTVGLTNGRLRGLQTFRRASSAKFSVEGGFFIIDADLVVNNLGVGISYDGGLTGSLPGSFTASGTIRNVNIKIKLRVNPATMQVELMTFDVVGNPVPDLAISGFPSIINGLLDPVRGWIGDEATGVLVNILNSVIKASLGDVVGNILFPPIKVLV